MVKRLKELRNCAKISQQQLADIIGISQQSINKYENHNVEPDIATLISLADYFHTSVDYLIGNSDINRIAESVSPLDLNEEEMNLVSEYRKLIPQEKNLVNCTIQAFNQYK